MDTGYEGGAAAEWPDRRESKQQEDGGQGVTTSFVTLTLHQVLHC
jgi:hypothetical protein